jgi:hypothetical protein
MADIVGLKPSDTIRTTYTWKQFHDHVSKLPADKKPTAAWLTAQKNGLKPSIVTWKTYDWKDYNRDSRAR